MKSRQPVRYYATFFVESKKTVIAMYIGEYEDLGKYLPTVENLFDNTRLVGIALWNNGIPYIMSETVLKTFERDGWKIIRLYPQR